jgi:flagellar basal body-associated protein FliL
MNSDKNFVDGEMRSDIQEQKKTKPGNMILMIIGIVVALMVVALVGGFFSTDSNEGQHNMGAVTSQDTLIVTKSDTLKQ